MVALPTTGAVLAMRPIAARVVTKCGLRVALPSSSAVLGVRPIAASLAKAMPSSFAVDREVGLVRRPLVACVEMAAPLARAAVIASRKPTKMRLVTARPWSTRPIVEALTAIVSWLAGPQWPR